MRYATLLFGAETAIVSLGGGGTLQIYRKTAQELAAGSGGRWTLSEPVVA